MRALLAILITSALACGGKYASSERMPSEADRGETNGRTFDFVSNLPDGEDWQIRIRDSALWASYSEGQASQEYKPVNLDKDETRRLWDLIDNLNLPDRKKGKQDEEDGYFLLRLREPGGDEGHDVLKLPNRVRCYDAITSFFSTQLNPS